MRRYAAAGAIALTLAACGSSSAKATDGAPSTAASSASSASSAASSSASSAGSGASDPATTASGNAAVDSAASSIAAGITAPAADAVGLCTLFTTAELSDLVGVKLGQGETAGPLGSACQWSGDSDTEAQFVQVQVADASSWEGRSSSIEGYQAIPDLSDEAWAVPGIAGFTAAAPLPAGKVTFVSVAGGKTTIELAISLLHEAITRNS